MVENEDFATELVEQMAEARRFAPKTACSYKSVARQWCAYIDSTPFAAATEEDAASWLASCSAMSGKTIYHRLCVMRRLYHYAVRSGAAISNPFDSERLEANYRRVELDVTRQDPVEPWEIERILAYATRVCASRETSRSVWLRTVLDNAIARLHIIHSLSFPDISRLRVCDFADGYAAGAMRVTAADGSQRYIDLDPDTASAVRSALALRDDPKADEALFVIMVGEKKGKPLSSDALGNRINRMCKRAGVDVRSRNFNLGLAKAAKEANASAAELSALARGKSLTPRGLALIADDDARAAWERMKMGISDKTPRAAGRISFRTLAVGLLVNKDADVLEVSIWPDGHVELKPVA